MTVFDRIKNLCELKGISISQLEERIEISSGAAYKWKTSSPSQKMFQKLSSFFDVSTDYLMTGEETRLTVEQASIDVQLARQQKRIKEYMLKFANLSDDKRNQIMSLIDMLEDK